MYLAETAAGLLGLAIGSFLNVVVHRVPRGGSLTQPGSSCPSCGTRLKPLDNVPVLSWLWLRGRCRTCGARISARYPLIEALTAVLFVVAVLRYDDLEVAAFVAAASAVFVALSFIDLEHRRVPNVIVLPAAAVALVWVGAASLLRGDPTLIAWSVAGGVGFFTLMLLIALISPGGMGMGDVKLALFIGVVAGRFGPGAVAVAVMAGFFVGGLVAVAVLITGRGGRKTAVPFAPMLCVGAMIALYLGRPLVSAWLGV
ncbi:MAG TPA: prepilin peptidase [Actinomycetota bacterium]|nr:prepilin peptidase [Actinomycetota bacterium]